MNQICKVGLVEDNLFQRRFFEKIIQSAKGFTLHGSFSDGPELLEKFPTFQPDILLLDMHLGAVSSLELISEVKKEHFSGHILVCSADDNIDTIYQALLAGADGYILKDAKPNQIIKALSEVCRGEVAISGMIIKKLINRIRGKYLVEISSEENLSKRQEEILSLLVKGKFYKEIAAELSISVETVRKHAHNIYKKMSVGNRLEAYNKLTNYHNGYSG